MTRPFPLLPFRCIALCVLASLLGLAIAGTARANDWPQWGGTDGRNQVSSEKNLPDNFVPVKSAAEIAATPGCNVRWVAPLGGTAYGNPTVANGRVFVGTDDKTLDEDPRFTRTQGGMVKCFDEKTGTLLWQLVVPKRTTGYGKEVLYGHQHLGVCSSPLVDGEFAYIMSHQTDVMCLSVHGQDGGNRGPFTDESTFCAGAGKKPIELRKTDGDIIWRFDLMDQLKVIPHDTASCSVLMHGDVLYLSTSNGVDRPHTSMLNPEAPALVALDKHTGRFLAKENEKISTRIFHCQWSPPSLGKVGDKTLIFFGGADGICYAFEALESVPEKPVDLKCVWKFDCNPPEYKTRDGKPVIYIKGDKRKKDSPNKNDGSYVGPSEIIGSPVFVNGKVYVATGQDPMHGRGRGMLVCIDPSKTGDITATGMVWRYDALDRTIGTPTIADGLLYIPDVAGRLHCVEAETGKPVWVYEAQAETWGSVLVADGKLYWGTSKDFFIMAAGREAKVLNKLRLGSPVYSTPIVANGTVYVASQRFLWAVGK